MGYENKVAIEQLKVTINTKLYKQHQDFIDQGPDNTVVITLGNKGSINIEKKHKDEIVETKHFDYFTWIYGV